MKFDNNIPIYLQIMNDIKKKVITGILKEEEKIPSIRMYCSEYEVTSLTMQRAISELERGNILYTKKGVGSFISKGITGKLRKEVSQNLVFDFVDNIKSIGLSDEEIIRIVKEELNNG